MVFLDKFNEVTGDKYKYIKVQKIDIDKDKLSARVFLLVPYDKLDNLITMQDRMYILDSVRSIIPSTFNVEVEFVKSYVDERLVKNMALEYFKIKHPTIVIENNDISVKIDKEIVYITILMKSTFYDFFMTNDIKSSITKYMEHKYCNETIVELVDSKKDFDIDTDFAGEESINVVARKIKTSNHEKVVGKDISSKAKYIIDKKAVEEKAVYAGEVVDFKRLASKKTGNSYYTICISDGTGTLMCKAFAKYSGEGVYDTINIGEEIIVSGNIQEDTFQHDSVLMIRDISRCIIDKSSIILKEELNGEPKNYVSVFPELYKNDMIVANDLFTDNVVECPQSMKGKTYVVFDVETTGLDNATCDIIELAGVKVVDGIITETFSTFVNQGVVIPEEITNLTNITNKDIKDAPNMSTVLPDFYKFTRGTILVAHNAQFDKGFIDKYAKMYRYLFDNRVIDTIAVAKKTVILPKYKLGELCKHFKISLEGAHRAVNDCEATAKLLIELAKLGGLD